MPYLKDDVVYQRSPRDWDAISHEMLEKLNMEHIQFNASWMKKEFIEKVTIIEHGNFLFTHLIQRLRCEVEPLPILAGFVIGSYHSLGCLIVTNYKISTSKLDRIHRITCNLVIRASMVGPFGGEGTDEKNGTGPQARHKFCLQVSFS